MVSHPNLRRHRMDSSRSLHAHAATRIHKAARRWFKRCSSHPRGAIACTFFLIKLRLYASLPLRSLSRLWGYINGLELPVSLRVPIYKTYSYLFGCNLDEMLEPDLKKYVHLGDFFYRALKPGVRTIATPKETPLVSPGDGTILNFGKVRDDHVEQVKGITYSLDALLGYRPNYKTPRDGHTYIPKKGNCMYSVVIYLAPGDYHRFHSPTEWKIETLRHFAGKN